MLAHFMLFSEADIEYRFLMATNLLMEDEVPNPLVDSKENNVKSVSSRFHKISLGVVSAKNRRNRNNKL
jgi:hypothetical protein